MYQKSFTHYLASNYEDELFNAVAGFIQKNPDELDLYSYQADVDNLDEIELDSISIKTTYIRDTDIMKLDFDVLVVGEICFQEVTRHNDFEDNCSKWFRVTCSAEMNGSLKNFKITDVDTYDRNKGKRFGNLLSDQLVPILHKDDLEKTAEDFLKKYHPLALEVPMAIDPYYVVNKMGLMVVESVMDEECATLGQIYFRDVQDEKTGKAINAGTIMIDSRIEEELTLGAKNNTIIHECVHWEKHRKAFELERFYDLSLSNITTRVNFVKGFDTATATDWMEWHARALTPKIMMPRKMFQQESEMLFREYSQKYGRSDSLDVIESVIDDLATYFGVSRLAAKIRMVELGYEEAIGAFNYVDGRYVPTHSWKKGFVKNNQTFCIDEISAAIETWVNPDFAEEINSGKYVYVDSHFVLNTPQYLQYDFWGNLVLTDYARHNMHECALLFTISSRTKSGSADFQLSCVLNRDKDAPYELEIKFHKGYENSTPEKQAEYLAEIMVDNDRMYNSLSNDPTDCLKKVLEWRGMTRKALADKIPMEEKQIRRIINGESNGSIQSMVSICLALYLPPEISLHIIEKSNLSFKFNDDSHKWYKFVLMNYVGKSLDETRAFLKKYNVTL
ncbi:helix-turn-helix transcriptional regulator [Lactococcus formosensis]|uniref:helix-turn-helix transcriptional regulator n=1 Tax=Lactococcus formosensis TaxID=1281486 RepID=UPI0024359C5F|nr:helix-turn-helix transcriptional regulator [Lactococcus formosensis]MDG6162104.1 helix-turn-helix transcriptional regulator [Lactococcus formosensis]